MTMSKAEAYWREAEFCAQQAKTISDYDARQQFTRLAEQWRELADRAEGIERRRNYWLN
jgi:hypothetical protein